MNENRLRLIMLVVGILVIISIISFIYFVWIPFNEQARLEYFESHQKTKFGKIILVVPEGNHPHDPDGAVYFEDGDIMKHWKRGNYNDFQKYINKEVKIVYGEIKAYSGTEKMLFSIEEMKDV